MSEKSWHQVTVRADCSHGLVTETVGGTGRYPARKETVLLVKMPEKTRVKTLFVILVLSAQLCARMVCRAYAGNRLTVFGDSPSDHLNGSPDTPLSNAAPPESRMTVRRFLSKSLTLIGC
jgi:hypothetical protein